MDSNTFRALEAATNAGNGVAELDAQKNRALTSNGVPSASLATPGKLCIDLATGDLYKCAVAGTWIKQTDPDAYIKSALVSDNTLTLTNQDDSTVSFTPEETEIDDTLSQAGQAADAKAAGDRIAQLEYAVFHAENWELIQTLVRAGLGETAYPVGTQFIVPHEIYGELVFDVVAHDHHVKADDADAHTMTLMMHNVISSKVYSAPEALYYVSADEFPDGLTAGTYYFEIPESLSTSASFEGWDGIQITLTSAVPAGGQIAVAWTDGYISGAKFSTRATPTASNTESNIVPTNGTEGTSLGEIGSIGAEYDGVHNYYMFSRRGNNNWKESNLRQWANSSDETFSFAPQNPFDRLASGYNVPGFAYGFDTDFLAALTPVKIKSCTNKVFSPVPEAGAELVETTDTFFPASWTEIIGTAQSGIKDEAVLPYYDGATASQRIKYRADATTTAAPYALRSNQPAYAYNAVEITATGITGGFYAYTGVTLAFCCVVG